MNVTIKHAAITVAALIAAVGLSACGSTSQPLTQAPAATSSASEQPSEEPSQEPSAEEPAAKATSCDIAREAILTGTPAEITKAMKGLVADKKADATAREYARYYMGRDKGNKDLREMDVSLIQASCM